MSDCSAGLWRVGAPAHVREKMVYLELTRRLMDFAAGKFVLNDRKPHGFVLPNGTAVGLVQELVTGRVDLSTPDFIASKNRLQVVPVLSIPVVYTDLQFVFNRAAARSSEEFSWHSIFDHQTWICVAVSLIVVVVCVHMLRRRHSLTLKALLSFLYFFLMPIHFTFSANLLHHQITVVQAPLQTLDEVPGAIVSGRFKIRQAPFSVVLLSMLISERQQEEVMAALKINPPIIMPGNEQLDYISRHRNVFAIELDADAQCPIGLECSSLFFKTISVHFNFILLSPSLPRLCRERLQRAAASLHSYGFVSRSRRRYGSHWSNFGREVIEDGVISRRDILLIAELFTGSLICAVLCFLAELADGLMRRLQTVYCSAIRQASI